MTDGLNAPGLGERRQKLTEVLKRVGARTVGRGPPEVLRGLSAEAQRLFPSRESDLLKFMAGHLRRTGQSDRHRLNVGSDDGSRATEPGS